MKNYDIYFENWENIDADHSQISIRTANVKYKLNEEPEQSCARREIKARGLRVVIFHRSPFLTVIDVLGRIGCSTTPEYIYRLTDNGRLRSHYGCLRQGWTNRDQLNSKQLYLPNGAIYVVICRTIEASRGGYLLNAYMSSKSRNAYVTPRVTQFFQLTLLLEYSGKTSQVG